MTRLLVATTNPDKLREIQAILGRLSVDILTLHDLDPVPEPEETGTTFAQNARLKAQYYDRCLDTTQGERPYTVAEDSGLVVDALGGEPGIHSARFLGPDASYRKDLRRFIVVCRTYRLRRGGHDSSVRLPWCATARSSSKQTARWKVRSPTSLGEPAASGTTRSSTTRRSGCTLGEVSDDEKLGRVAHRGEAFVGRRSGWKREYRTENDVLFSVPSPRVWPRAVDLIGAARVAGGGAFRPVGLTAREVGLSPTDRAGKLSNVRRGLIRPE